MKKTFALVLTGLLALALIYGAVAETPAAGTAPEAQASVPALSAEELDALLATKLEGGNTLGDVLTQTGVLDTFKSAQPFQQVQILRAQLTLGKISQADAQTLLTALRAGLVGENTGFGPWASGDKKGGNWNRGGMMGGRRGIGGRRNANPNGFRGGMMHGGRGMMGGMMGGWQGAGPGWQNHPCPYFQQQTTPGTTPENP